MHRLAGLSGCLSLLACLPCLACAASIRRPVETTEAATRLEQVTVSDSNEFDPAVSPDARAIAYEVAATPDAEPHIEVMPLDGVGSGRRGAVAYSSRSRGLTGLEPSWMPDGSGLVFLTRHPERAMPGPATLIRVFGLGSDRPPYASDVGDYSFAGEWPAVAPDGATVAMSIGGLGVFATGWRTTKNYGQALGLSDFVGTGVTAIGEGTEPAWSPDGKQLAFVRAEAGRAHLFVAGPDGKEPHRLTDGLDDDEQPSWSPDGKLIVFSAHHPVESGGQQANLFMVNPDGSGLVQLTEGDRLACRPAWAKDGFVYFHANVTDRFHIWRVRPR